MTVFLSPTVAQWVLVGLALATLALAPALHAVARRFPAALQAVDGFVLVSIVSLVVAHVLPEAFTEAGPAVLLVATAGALGPAQLERWQRRRGRARRVHGAALAVAAGGILIHAFLDGLALGAPVEAPHGGAPGLPALGVAVVIHRFAVALTLWWVTRPLLGVRGAAGLLVAMGLATLAGFGATATMGAVMPPVAAGLLAAFVGGTLLHVVMHGPHAAPHELAVRGWHLEESAGGLVGLVLVVAFLHVEPPAIGWFASEAAVRSVPDTMVALGALMAPWLLAGQLLAATAHAVSVRRARVWPASGGVWRNAVVGALRGLPLPLCACDVAPAWQHAVASGAAGAAAAAFLAGAPAMGFDAALVSLPLLGVSLTLARLGGAVLVAVVTGVLTARWLQRRARSASSPESALSGHADCGEAADSRPPSVARAWSEGWWRAVDDTAPWVLLGVGAGAVVLHALHGRDLAAVVPRGWQVPLAALAALPVHVCATGATPLVAALLARGLTPAAALAFLLVGPATSAATFRGLARTWSRRAAAVWAASLVAVAVGTAWVLAALVPAGGVARSLGGALRSPEPLSLAALGLVGLFVGVSAVRQGPRHFVEQILGLLPRHHHEAPCGHDAGEFDGEVRDVHDHGAGFLTPPPAPCARPGAALRTERTHKATPGA